MKKTYVAYGLGLTIVLQVAIMLGGYVLAAAPLWFGEEVKVKVRPVDPRSLFRGNYVRLGYDVSVVPADDLDREAMRIGEEVFVSMRLGTDGLYEYESSALTRPENGVYLRGRVTQEFQRNQSAHLRVRYGIEAFFLPVDAALELERDLAKGAIATLMVTQSGRAAIKDVQALDE